MERIKGMPGAMTMVSTFPHAAVFELGIVHVIHAQYALA